MPNKTALKTALYEEQGGLCSLTSLPLEIDLSLTDTDRRNLKKDNGKYTDPGNTRLADPVAHMRRHGNYRERTPAYDHLKSTFDDRVQMMKLMLKINNQILAYGRRVDHKQDETAQFLNASLKPIEQRIAQIDRALVLALREVEKEDPLVRAALGVKGLGPITVAALTVYIDFAKMVCNRCHRSLKDKTIEDDASEKTTYCKCDGEITLCAAAATPSALWKYVGLHCASHERYTKGEAGGGNKTLRTVLYNTACVLMKLGEGGYRDVYDRTKLRLSLSEKIVKTRNTAGKLVDLPWRETKPSHRHGAALRAIIKHLLADYWLVGRTLAGLPTTPLYVETVLGHTHIIDPAARGWTFGAE